MTTHEPETSHERQAYANFIFPSRHQAEAFVGLITETDWQAELAYAPDRGCWRVVVQRRILILHREVTSWCAALTARAACVGGDYDDWGVVKP